MELCCTDEPEAPHVHSHCLSCEKQRQAGIRGWDAPEEMLRGRAGAAAPKSSLGMEFCSSAGQTRLHRQSIIAPNPSDVEETPAFPQTNPASSSLPSSIDPSRSLLVNDGIADNCSASVAPLQVSSSAFGGLSPRAWQVCSYFVCLFLKGWWRD